MKQLFAALALLASLSPALAQQNRGTLNKSVTITTGGTFQQVLPADPRWELTINNNNASDDCWIYLGSGTATEGTAIRLPAGQTYMRVQGYVPSDEVQATCKTSADTLYVDVQ